jgi:formylglycine-generating enzyme required for sulfatase activity/pimeloyl-ACP methyl ester carboxylesterase
MVCIPAGSFLMGLPPIEDDFLEKGTSPDPRPQTQVTITCNYYIGKYEVTQAQYLSLMDNWPNLDEDDLCDVPSYDLSDNKPLYCLNYDKFQEFLLALNSYMISSGQDRIEMRLPTSAEWEHSCRAGTTTRFYFGDSFVDPALGGDGCGDDGVRSQYMWFCGNSDEIIESESVNKLYPRGMNNVGQKLPNDFGLYDMHGNVKEWCSDWITFEYPGGDLVDPTGPTMDIGFGRVSRGGSIYSIALSCLSGEILEKSEYADDDTGFRLAASTRKKVEVLHLGAVNRRQDVLLTSLGGLPLKVCADGSSSTVFRIRGVSELNANPEEYEFFQSGLGSDDPLIVGSISYKGIGSADSFDFLYQHPDFYDLEQTVRNGLIFIYFRGQKAYQIPIEIYRAPVLMLHGLWGNAEGFEDMEEALLDYWDPRLLLRHEYPNELSFEDNSFTASWGANTLLDKLVFDHKISAGRVDVVAHSMGGILTRIHFQEQEEQGNVIRSLLTIDTPHWGSQFANWLTGSSPGSRLDVLEPVAQFLGKIGEIGLRAPAVHDLAVRGPANNILATGVIKESAPMHFVASRNPTGGVALGMEVALYVAAYLDGFRTTVERPFPLPPLVKGNPAALISAIFGGRQHDGIVALESQLGGMNFSSPSVQIFNGLHHAGIQEQDIVINHVVDVLKTPQTDPRWAARVQPIPNSFVYNFSVNNSAIQKKRLQEGGITITQPLSTSIVAPGQNITINVEGEKPFEFALLTVLYNDEISENILPLPISFSMAIPEISYGSLIITAAGLTTIEEDDPIAFDSVILDVIPNGTASELEISPSQGLIILKNQKGYFSTQANYPSGASIGLDRTSVISTEITNSSIARVGDDLSIEGLEIGETELIVRYSGLEDRISIKVLPPDAWDPIRNMNGLIVY